MKKKEKRRLETGLAGERTVSGRSKAKSAFLLAGLCLCFGGFPSFAAVSAEGATGSQADQEVRIRYSEISDTRDELPEPDRLWTDEEGISWKLKNSRVLTVPLTGRSRQVSGEVVYPEVTGRTEIPKTAVTEVKDEESGQTLTVSLPLTDTEYEKERWSEDLEFAVTFHSYGADVYTFGERKIPHQSEQPPLTECREELLAAIGMTEDECRLEEFEWAGEAYTDETGVLCRNASVRGSRRVWDCRAVYGGEVLLPDVNRYRLQMEYTRLEETEAWEEETEVSATVYPPEPDGAEAEEGDSFFQWLLRHSRTIAVSLLTLFLMILGFVLLRRRAETLDGKN